MTKERVCANTPTLSRRTLLTALPVAGVSFALPSPVFSAQPIDRHAIWHAQFNHVRELWAVQDQDSQEAETLWAIGDLYEKLICNTVAQTKAGLRAQMEFLVEHGQEFWGMDVHKSLAQNVLRGLSN
jgi:hypothetical protein